MKFFSIFNFFSNFVKSHFKTLKTPLISENQQNKSDISIIKGGEKSLRGQTPQMNFTI